MTRCGALLDTFTTIVDAVCNNADCPLGVTLPCAAAAIVSYSKADVHTSLPPPPPPRNKAPPDPAIFQHRCVPAKTVGLMLSLGVKWRQTVSSDAEWCLGVFLLLRHHTSVVAVAHVPGCLSMCSGFPSSMCVSVRERTTLCVSAVLPCDCCCLVSQPRPFY